MAKTARTAAAAAAGLLALTLFGCGGAGKPTYWTRQGPYVVHRAPGEITIDDRSHPADWADAMVIRAFVVPASGKPARDTTELRMLWDDRHLYVHFIALDADLRGTYTKRDDPIYREDVVELFIKPYEDKPFYYEFEVNPIGTVMALEIPGLKEKAGMALSDMSQWQTGIRCAVKADGTVNKPKDRDKSFRVVMAIPWKNMKHIGSPPKAGEVWKFNGAR